MQELTDKGSGRIPVFVELRSLGRDGLRTLLHSALERLGFEINAKLFDLYARSGRLVLLLDAFDEIQVEYVPRAIYDLEELSEKYEQCQILVTSRPDSEIQKSRHFVVTRLAPITPQDHEPFLIRIGIGKDERKRLVAAIKSSNSQVADLLTTPLVMTLLATLYQAEKSIPQDVPEFYERLFHTLFTTHDATKPGLVRRLKCQLGERRLEQLFEAFCFSVLQQEQGGLMTIREFNSCLEMATRTAAIRCDADAFRHDLTRIACLLSEEGGNIEFIHKSVAEFYAASFISSLSDETAPALYEQLLRNQHHAWRQVLQFLSQIDEYRYARYYGLPAIDEALATIGDVSQVPPPGHLKPAFVQLFGNFMVGLHEEGEGLRLSQMGPYHQKPFMEPIWEALSDALLSRFRELQVPKEMFKDKFVSRESLASNWDPELLFVRWAHVLDSEDLNRLELRLDSCVEALFKQKQEFDELLARDRQRIQLISLKLSEIPRPVT